MWPPHLEHPKTETWHTNSSITSSLIVNLAWENIHSGGPLPLSQPLWSLTGNPPQNTVYTLNASSPIVHKTPKTSPRWHTSAPSSSWWVLPSAAAREPFLSRPTACFISLSCVSHFFSIVRHFFTCKATFQMRASPLQPLAGTLLPRRDLTAGDQMRAAVEKQLLGTYSLYLVPSAPPRRAGFLSCSDFTVRTPGPVCRNRVLLQVAKMVGKVGPFRCSAGAAVPLKHCLKTATRPHHSLELFRVWLSKYLLLEGRTSRWRSTLAH